MARGKRISTTARGKEFEGVVASLYEALGFRVERNLREQGQQIDLIAQKAMPGAGRIRIGVECKYLSAGNVSNQAVYDFAHFFDRARENLSLSIGVIVTNRDFTIDAKQAATKESNIELKRQTEL